MVLLTGALAVVLLLLLGTAVVLLLQELLLVLVCLAGALLPLSCPAALLLLDLLHQVAAAASVAYELRGRQAPVVLQAGEPCPSGPAWAASADPAWAAGADSSD